MEKESNLHPPNLSSVRPDWEWQPAINRAITRQMISATLQMDQAQLKDTLIMRGLNHRSSFELQSDSLSYKALAWRDAAGKVHLVFGPKSEITSETQVTGPLSKSAPFALADVNRDGYLDAFVGMPPMPLEYPLSGESQLLFGNKGGFQRKDGSDIPDDIGNVHISNIIRDIGTILSLKPALVAKK